jgi:hypothetical protein
VEEGHQFVLTYNLFINQRVGEALRDTSTADPTLFPLYAGVKEMLDHPGFMKKGKFDCHSHMLQILTHSNVGGVLGFYCQYPYPHVHPNAAKQLPPSLQGVDMVFYSVFKSLGLKIDILPLLDSSPLDEMDEMEYEREEECYIDDPWSYREFYCDSDEENDIWECEYCRPEFPSFEEWKAKKPRVDRIGTKLHGLKFTEDGSDEAMYIRSQKEEVRFPSFLPSFVSQKLLIDVFIESDGVLVMEGVRGYQVVE